MTNFLMCQELPEPRHVESLWTLGYDWDSGASQGRRQPRAARADGVPASPAAPGLVARRRHLTLRPAVGPAATNHKRPGRAVSLDRWLRNWNRNYRTGNTGKITLRG